MADLAKLVIEVDSKGARVASGSLKGLEHQSARTEKATRSLGKTTGSSSAAFSTLKMGVTGLIIAFTALATVAIAKSIKAASDMEETTSKFDTVFAGMRSEAEKMANTLVESYGMGSYAAKTLLSDTADILQGFGLTTKASAAMSFEIQKISADIASFKNVQGGAGRVSEAITKAMLGEREMLKTLGIAILETDVQQRLLEKGQKGLTGTALRAAKAQATFELVMERSANSVGDIAKTYYSFANQTRILDGRVKDVSITFGQAFLPVATLAVITANEMALKANKAAAGFRDWVKSAEGAKIISSILSQIIGWIMALWGILQPVFSTFKQVISDVGKAMEDLGGSVGGTSTGLLVLSAGAQVIIAAFRIVGAVIVAVITTLSNFINSIKAAADGFAAFKDFISGKATWEELKQRAGDAASKVGKAASNVGSSWKNVYTTVKGEIKKFGDEVDKSHNRALKTYGDSSKKWGDSIYKVLTAVQKKSADVAKNVQKNNKDVSSGKGLKERYLRLIGFQKAMNDGISTGIAKSAIFNDMWKKIGETYKNKIGKDFKELEKSMDGLDEKSKKALANAIKTAKIFAQVLTGFTQIVLDSTLEGFKELGEAFADGSITGKEFLNVMASIAKRILDQLPLLFMQAGLTAIANGNWPLGLGLLAAAAGTAFVSGFVNGATEQSAKGNVFDSGSVVPFANGGAFSNSVVGSPTFFPMANGGVGLMGEAGPEAIMPLTRGADGKLGVTANGGSGVNIVIHNYSGQPIEAKESEKDGMKQIEIMVGAVTRKQFAEGKMDQTMANRYNLKAKGRM